MNFIKKAGINPLFSPGPLQTGIFLKLPVKSGKTGSKSVLICKGKIPVTD